MNIFKRTINYIRHSLGLAPAYFDDKPNSIVVKGVDPALLFNDDQMSEVINICDDRHE